MDDDRLTDNDCTADNLAAENKKPELRKNEEKVSRQTIKLYIDESKGDFTILPYKSYLTVLWFIDHWEILVASFNSTSNY